MWKMRTQMFLAIVLAVLPYKSEGQVCPDPPEVDNAKVTQVAVYKCKEEFLTCSNQCVSVFQPSGQWEKLANICERFIYYNIRGDTKVKIPCKPSSYLRVKLFATLMKPTRGTFNIRKGEDILFHVSLRHNAAGSRDKTVLDMKLNNRYRKAKYLPKNYLPLGKQTSIIITLNNGIYEFEVNGKVVYKYQEVLKGAKPDAVEIRDDMLVHTLVMSIEKFY